MVVGFFFGGGGGGFLLFAHLLNRWEVLGSYCVTVKSLCMAMGIGTSQKFGAWKHLNKGMLLFALLSALMLHIGRAVNLIVICVVWQNCKPFWAHFLWKMALYLSSSLLSLLWFYCLCWDCPQWKRWIIFTREKLSVTFTLPYLMVDVCASVCRHCQTDFIVVFRSAVNVVTRTEMKTVILYVHRSEWTMNVYTYYCVCCVCI